MEGTLTSLMDGQARVAVVDDDHRLRTLIQEELIDEGVLPIPCTSGEELLELIKQDQIDLILLDLMMPGMDGMSCLRALEGISCGVPVLVVTALSDEIKREEVMNHGASEYILKPDLFERLPDLLNQYLPGRS